jgi:hypothetical protein
MDSKRIVVYIDGENLIHQLAELVLIQTLQYKSILLHANNY